MKILKVELPSRLYDFGPILRAIGLYCLIFLVSCVTAVPNLPPTAIAEQTAVLQPTPTDVVEQPTNSPAALQSTPTLATNSEALPDEVPTLTPIPTLPANLSSIGDPYAPELGNLGYDVQHYDIQLSIDPSKATIAGIVTITAVATQSLSQFSLDFIGYEINAIELNGESAKHGRQNGKLNIVSSPSHRCR